MNNVLTETGHTTRREGGLLNR